MNLVLSFQQKLLWAEELIWSNISKEYSEESSNKYDISALNNIRIKSTSENLSRNANISKYECFKLIGGPQCSINNFDETAWAETLRDFRNWSCIKFKDLVSIFQLLSEDLRKQTLLLVGKKILYTSTEDYTYKLESESGMHLRNIPKNILEFLHNKDAECNIFASVFDTKEVKNDTFSCQIL